MFYFVNNNIIHKLFIHGKLSKLEINSLTLFEALTKLYELQKKVRE
jgi:hypothetical protein